MATIARWARRKLQEYLDRNMERLQELNVIIEADGNIPDVVVVGVTTLILVAATVFAAHVSAVMFPYEADSDVSLTTRFVPFVIGFTVIVVLA